METKFCTDEYRPVWWRPSLAISAYEPNAKDLPEELCDKKITFLKITCSISGLTLSPLERRVLISSLASIRIQPKLLEAIIDDYLGCYGAQLRVSVFPFDNILYGVPHTKNSIDFGKFTTADRLSNPYLPDKNTTFEFPDLGHGEGKVTIVDRYPHPNTDGKGELALNEDGSTGRLMITIKPSTKVEAKVVLTGTIQGEISMSAFNGDVLIGSKVTPPPPQGLDKVHTLEVLSTDINTPIDKVIIEATQFTHVYPASLLEFIYYKPIPNEDFPRIVDFEPKKRELYQAGTEEGEILSASRSEINTSKSFMHTRTTESGWNVSGKLSISPGQKEGGTGAEVSGGYKNTTTDVDQSNLNVTVDASRERRERQSTSTSISQLYNLLSGYHIGSNEVTFLMLPRPHTMQPTDKRTLIRGLRIMEGIQEFFLIVVRPKNINKVAVNAFLETGHFPEKDAESVEYDLSYEDFEVSHWAFETPNIGAGTFSSTYVVREGYIIDYDAKEEDAAKRKIPDPDDIGFPFPLPFLNPKKPDSFHRGVALIGKIICQQESSESISLPHEGPDRFTTTGGNFRNFRMLHHSYNAENATTVKVEGIAESAGGVSKGGFVGSYRVFTRSEKPINNFNRKMLKLATGLCTAFQSPEDGISCLTPIPLNKSTRYIVDEPAVVTAPPNFLDEQLIASRVYKSYLGQSEKTFIGTAQTKLSDLNLGNEIGSNQSATMNTFSSRMPHIKELISNIKIAMTSTSAYYDPSLTMSILDTDYIKEKIKRALPKEYLDQSIHKVADTIPTNLEPMKKITIRQLLDMDLNNFAYESKLSLKDALKLRRRLLRIGQEEDSKPEKTIGAKTEKRIVKRDDQRIISAKKKKSNKKRR